MIALVKGTKENWPVQLTVLVSTSNSKRLNLNKQGVIPGQFGK